MNKKLKLTKQAFKNYFESQTSVWLLQNDNFIKEMKRFPILKKLNPYRSKQLINPKEIKNTDIPSTILDGNEVSDLSKVFFRKKYSDFKEYDFSTVWDLSDGKLIAEIKRIILEEDNFFIFEAPFIYKDFTLRTDIIIKSNGIIKVIEVKAVTEALKEHMYDLSYQHFILSKLFDLNHFHFRLMHLNNAFNYNQKLSIEEQVLELLSISDSYYNSRPTRDEFGDIKSKSKPLLENILKLEHDNDFDLIFDKIIEIQSRDDKPKEDIDKKLNIFHTNEYLPYYYEEAGIIEDNSLFNYRGDSGFSISKKTNLFYEHKYRLIEEVPDEFLVSSKIDPKEIVNKRNNDRKLYLRNNKLLRLIQKDATIDQSEHIEIEKIKEHLSLYKLPIYMFDFEAVNFAVPKINNASPYEQVPYQYSIHVIHSLDELDYLDEKTFTHREYLAQDQENFYEDLFVNLVKDLTEFGFGTYVAYNKAFEQMVIKKALDGKKMLSEEVKTKLEKINNSIIDLMVPFKEMYYYHPNLKGKYSIKGVTKLFTNLNYQDLDEIVRKGDQSSAQCKYWLSEKNETSRKRWNEIRPNMLEYCKYDTLSMVGIFQELIKKVK